MRRKDIGYLAAVLTRRDDQTKPKEETITATQTLRRPGLLCGRAVLVSTGWITKS